MFLSKSSILNAMNDNSISIVCHYYEDENGESFFSKKLDLNNNNNKKRKLFLQKQIEGTRVSLTLGPLLHFINETKVPDEQKYHNYKNILDLTQEATKGKYQLKPNESVVVLTNEYIKLKNSLCGLIISRVHNNSLGLSVKSSYVSNGWTGLLKLTLTNESTSPFLLTHGMNIAGLFLSEVKITDENKDNNIEHLSANHHGLTWQSVYDRNENPFTSVPISSSEKKTNFFKKLWGKLFDIKYDLAILSLIVGIIYGFLDIKNKVNSLSKEKEKLNTVKNNLDMLLSSKYKSGLAILTIKKGDIKGFVNENIFGAISSSNYTIVNATNNKNIISSLDATVVGSGTHHKLNMELVLNSKQKEDIQFKIKWIIFP